MANREILRESDKVALQSQTDNNDHWYEKVAREAYVAGVAPLTGAVKDGYKSITEHPGETALSVAASVGIGVGLGYLSRGAGLGGMIARGAGAAMAVQFGREVINPQRWSTVRDTLADTWTNKQNFERNVDTMENVAGRFAFQTAVMAGFGAVGAKFGQGLQGKFSLASAEAGLPMAARLAEVTPGETAGRRFRADIKTGETNPWEIADGIVKPKETFKWGEFAELQKKMLVGKDAVALEHKAAIEAITTDGATLKGEMGKLTGELTTARTQLKEAQALTAENQAVRRAAQEVEALKARRQELPGKEAELASLERQIADQAKAKAEAKKHGGHEGDAGKKGKGAEKGDKGGDKADKGADAQPVDIKARARELREEIGRIKADTNDAVADSAINRARVRQSEAETALKGAQEAQPARVGGLEQRVSEIEAALGEKQSAHDALGGKLKDAIKAYDTRVSELMADNTRLVAKTDEAGTATNVGRGAAREVKGDKGGRSAAGGGDKPAGSDRGQAADGGQTRAVEPKKDTVVEKPVEVVKAPEVLAMEKADAALKTARESVVERKQKEELLSSASKMKREALTERAAIESGKKTFDTPEAREAALEATRVAEQRASADVRKAGKVQYFRPLNNINEYAKAAEGYLASEPNAAKRDAFVKDAVKNIEELMNGVPNSFKGHGSDKGIPSQSRGVTPEKRLAQLREHLDNRLSKMNTEHEAKVKESADQPVVKEAFGNITSGLTRERMLEVARQAVGRGIPEGRRDQVIAQAASSMYDNSTIAFFEKGKLVQNRGSDGQLHQQLFDVAKVERGQGRLDRLQGHKPEGYALVVPKVRTDGKLMELPQRRGNTVREGARDLTARPTYAKEVLEVGGVVPEGVRRGMSFGEVLKNFKGEPAAVKAADAQAGGSAYEAVAPKIEETSRAPAHNENREVGLPTDAHNENVEVNREGNPHNDNIEVVGGANVHSQNAGDATVGNSGTGT